ncbi:uncharacterized protein TrAFT101_005121 [Trichoderma asperellum]|uniref:uncharacterized protein n=1 Tax=Trichoderma asperellum TaxID=101201 RepID=UPI00331DE7EA|nr:hypothetical protein TrAFT101_005121 [Trichoderma asperellum]
MVAQLLRGSAGASFPGSVDKRDGRLGQHQHLASNGSTIQITRTRWPERRGIHGWLPFLRPRACETGFGLYSPSAAVVRSALWRIARCPAATGDLLLQLG